MNSRINSSIAALLIFSMCCGNTFSQNLKVQSGAFLKVSGGAFLKLQNLSLDVQGNLAAGGGTVELLGNAPATGVSIGGSSQVVFNHLTIRRSGGGQRVVLKKSIRVDGNLSFSEGLLDLNGNDLTLAQPNGKIVNESEQNRIVGAAGGEVLVSLDLDKPNQANPGNIGIAISSTKNLGATTIRRGHVTQTVAGAGKSTERYFDIAPAQNTNLNATLKFQYFDAELAGLSENSLQIFRKNGNSWQASNLIGGGNLTQNSIQNFVEKSGITHFSKLTLAACKPSGGTVESKICEGENYLFNGKKLTSAGIYKDTVQNLMGCDSIVTLALQVAPKPIAIAKNIVNIECTGDENGSAIIDVSGGTPPYFCSGSPNCQLTGLPSGSFTVVVSDANQCSQVLTFQIVVADTKPPTLTCPPSLTVCKGKAITIPAPVGEDNCDLPPNSLKLLSNLPPGNVFSQSQEVKWQITDAAGNTSTCSYQIEVAPEINLTYSVVHAPTGMGSINITSGGSGYTYLWKGPNNFSSTSEDISNLAAGEYTLVVTDNFGCTATWVIKVFSVGTSDLSEKISIRLLPNPASDFFKIEIRGTQVLRGNLCNLQGQPLREFSEFEFGKNLSIEDLPEGFYFLQLQLANGQWHSLKLLKN